MRHQSSGELPPVQDQVEFPFLQDGGVMGELIRNYDWTNNPVGSPDQWPDALRVSISILLRSKFPMFIWWGPTFICFYNDALRPILGYTNKHPGPLGKTAEAGFSEIWPGFRPIMNSVFSGGEATFREHQLLPIFRDGRLQDVYWTFGFTPIAGDDGRPAGLLTITTETTDVLRAKQKIEESELKFRTLIQNSPVCTFLFTGEQMIIEVANETVLKNWGKDGSVLGKSCMEALPELKEQLFDEKLQEVFATGEACSIKEAAIDFCKDGVWETCYYNFTLTPMRNSAAAIYGVLATAIDVTPTVLSRKIIEESESRFRTMVQQAPVAIGLTKGRNMIFQTVNEPMLELIDRTEDIIGKPMLEVLPELAGQPIIAELEKVYDTGQPYQGFEVPGSLKLKGLHHPRYYNVSYTPFFENGAVTGLLQVATDVTTQVLAKKKIIEAKAKARLAIDSADLGTYEVDLVTNEMKASQRFQTIWGVENSFAMEDFISRIHPQDLPQRASAFKQAYETGNLNYEARVITPERGERWLRLTGKVFYDEDKKPSYLLGIVQDITEHKLFTEELEKQVKQRTAELENKNRQLEEMNHELEQFTYAASHDMQEPLRKVQTFSSFLLKDHSAELGEEALGYLTKIGTSVQRMKAIIEDLLNYSQQSADQVHRGPVDLDHVLEEVQQDFASLLEAKNALIEKEPLPVIMGVKAQISLLFQNLVNNCLKFARTDVPPLLKITCKMLSAEEAAAVKLSEPGESYVQITFCDNGVGFEQQYAGHIFGLFKRLHPKSKYEGSGIGLGLCKKIVQNHKGAIWAESVPGEGSRFFVLLPVGTIDEQSLL